ncbi:transcriptional regulator, partial [Streptomyces sp. NPDC001274]
MGRLTGGDPSLLRRINSAVVLSQTSVGAASAGTAAMSGSAMPAPPMVTVSEA